MERFEKLVIKTAQKYSMGNPETFEDLCQVGRMVVWQTMQTTENAVYIKKAVDRQIRDASQTWAGHLTSGGKETKAIAGLVHEAFESGASVKALADEFKVSVSRIEGIINSRLAPADYNDLAEAIGSRPRECDFELKDAVHNAIEQLPIELQYYINLYYFEDMPLSKVAQEIGVAKTTAHRKLNKALDILRENRDLERIHN